MYARPQAMGTLLKSLIENIDENQFSVVGTMIDSERFHCRIIKKANHVWKLREVSMEKVQAELNKAQITGCMWFPGGASGKEPACLIPGLGKSPGGGHGNSL